MSDALKAHLGQKLVRHGIILFLLGLLTGFVIPLMQNPRMGLSSHLEAIMNGMFLVLLGLIWSRLRLSNRALMWGYALSLIGTYTNWATTLLAGIWGAGAEVMPIAGGSYQGAVWQEALVRIGLVTLSAAMIVVCGIHEARWYELLRWRIWSAVPASTNFSVDRRNPALEGFVFAAAAPADAPLYNFQGLRNLEIC